MPEAPSARLGLIGPSPTDLVSQGDDIIRALITRLDLFCLAGSSGTFAARPGSAVVDYYYYATDLGILYRYTGSAWVAVAGGAPVAHANTHLPGAVDSLDWTTIHRAGTYASRPAASGSVLGVRYYATDKSMEFECRLVAGTPTWLLNQAYAVPVSSLPSSPIDGQMVRFQPDSTGFPSIWWTLQYSSTRTRWEYVGGSAYVLQPASFATSNVGYTYTDLPSDWRWTPPKGGRYRISWHANTRNNSGAQVEFQAAVVFGGYSKNGSTATVENNAYEPQGGMAQTTEQPNGTQIRFQYINAGGSLTLDNAGIFIEPMYLLP